MKRRLTAIKILTLLFLVAAGTTAQGALLSDLLSGGTLHVGDKLFHDFEYVKVGDMPDPSAVNVDPFIDFLGDFGIQFQGAFLDAPGGGASDALIRFQVTVDPDVDAFITGATLTGNPAVIGGSGFIAVTETFLPQETTTSLSIYDLEPGPQKLSDTTAFNSGHKTIHVQKDIIALSAGDDQTPGGIPTLSFVTQTFHQTIVPEPATSTLMGIGLVALVWFRLRRK